MALTRALLHLSKIDDFAEWAATKGWVREPTKGIYEVLRLRKKGKPKPLIFHRRDSARHATIGWDQSPGHSLVRQWLRDRKQNERTR